MQRRTKTVAESLARYRRAVAALEALESGPQPTEAAAIAHREDVVVPRACREFGNSVLALMRTPAATVGECAHKLAILFHVQLCYFNLQVRWTGRKGFLVGDYDLIHSMRAMESEAKALLGMSLRMPSASSRTVRKAA